MGHLPIIRKISKAPFDCVRGKRYPQMLLSGVWFEELGFLKGDLVKIYNPAFGRIAIVHKAIDHLAVKDDRKFIMERTLSKSSSGHSMLLLQGKYLEQAGFWIDDRVEVAAPEPGVVTISIVERFSEIEHRRLELLEVGRQEWGKFYNLLRY